MRVVVTGYGMITAAGDNAEECWSTLTQPRSCIAENTIVSPDGAYTRLAGQVMSLADGPGPTRDRAIVLGLVALEEALGRSGLLQDGPYQPERCGLVVGTCNGGVRSGDRFHRQWIQDGLDKADYRLLLEYPLHPVADALAAAFTLNGPRTVHSNACAAGTVAIANAVEYLRDGFADMVVAGGVDPLSHLAFAGFSSLGALSHGVCAPYTRSDGLNLGEGAGFLVLEEYDKAMDRGATIFAEVLGYGLSADAYHPTAPDPRGRGALIAMGSAMTMAGVETGDIDYVNGHGTGTPANDSHELKTVLSLGDGKVPMSSTKSMIGHTLGAAGAVEAVVCVQSIVNQLIHPTYVPQDEVAQEKLAALTEEHKVDIVPCQTRQAVVDTVISNSFAFGGNNASLILAKDRGSDHSEAARPSRSGVSVTAVSAIAGSALNKDEIRDAFREDQVLYNDLVTLENNVTYRIGRPDESRLGSGVNPRVLRRTDSLGLLAVDAFAQLLKDRPLSPSELSGVGVVFATAHGPLSTVEAFQRRLITKQEGDNRLFPNTVMNAAAGHVAVAFGLHGPTATICAGGVSGVAALQFAHQLIANGSCDRVVVIAADEAPDALAAGFSTVPHYLSTDDLRPNANTGVVHSAGAVCILLEADEAAPDMVRHSRVLGFGLAGDDSGAGGLRADTTAWSRSFDIALQRSGLTAQDIDVVVSAATGRERSDQIEATAIARLGLRPSVPIIAPRGLTGDIRAGSSLLAFLVAEWLKSGERLMVRGEPAGLDWNRSKPLHALVSAFSIGGNYQSYVIEV